MNWKKYFYQNLRNRFLLLFFAVNGSLFALDPIGVVVGSEGITKVLDLNQGLRTLSQGGTVYLGDMIVVGEAAKINIKFVDGTFLTLIQKSQFWIDKFHYEQHNKNNVFEAELSNGGFRVLSGAIPKSNPENFKIHALSTTIGVRGTIFEAVIEDGNLYVHCDCGKVNVSNPLGTAVVGADEDSSFIEATRNEAPQQLKQRPEFFKKTLFLPPRNSLKCSPKMQRYESFIFENGVE